MMAAAKRADDAGGVRERILAAALGVLKEEGIQQLSQVQVARAAGVRQSHVTYYFPRRHDLVEAVGVRFVDGVTGALGVLQGAEASDPGALLRTMAQAIAEPGHMRMFAGMIVEADGDPALREMMVGVTLRMQQRVAELLGRPEAVDAAGAVLSALWGVGLYGFLRRPVPPTVLDAAIAGATAAWGAQGRSEG